MGLFFKTYGERFRSNLLRHIVLILLLKFLVLTALWWVLIKPNRIPMDSEKMGAHIVAPAANLNKENQHD